STYQELFDLLIDTYKNVIEQNNELTKRTMELMKSEERFKFLVQSVPDIIYKIDPNGRFTFVNNAVRRLGYEPEELIGRHFSEIIFGEDIDYVSREKVLPKYQGKTTGDKDSPRLFDERRGRDRLTTPLEVRIVAKEAKFVHPGIIEPIGSDIIFTDVNSFGIYEGITDTDPKKFQGTLGVISNKQFIGTTGVIRDLSERKKIENALLSDKGFLENILGNVTNGVFVFNDKGIIVLVNRGGANICGDNISNLIGVHYSKIIQAEKFEILFNKILAKSSHIIGEEIEIEQKNGAIRSISISLIPTYFEGRVINIVTTVEDITERKFSQEALELSEEKFRGISSFAIDGIIMIDEDGRVTYWNQAAEKIFGYKCTEIINSNLHEKIMPNKYWDTFSEGFLKYIKCGKGNIVGTTIELVGLNKNGEEFPVEISISSINMKNKWNAIGIVRDITRRKAIENKLNELNQNLQNLVKSEVEAHRQKDIMLIQQSKMASMGEMIGAIAHQWKQPLNALSLIVSDIKDTFDHNELDKEYINNIINQSKSQIEFMARTIDDFRNFFSPSKEKVQFSIVESINDISNIIIGQLKKLNIKVTFLCDSTNVFKQQGLKPNDYWEILTCEDAAKITLFGYQNEFKQVILNLLTNAMDAISHRCEKEKEFKGGKIFIKISKKEQDVLIEISDNGGGIPQELMERIWEPYFTTKTEQKGTGIGLYMSKSIIENSLKGSINVINVVDGAVFTLRFSC
ncbi:MAG: PAS domain S-box protein, partial [Nitrospirae bacterium]|nr:PAS domain S-box protein [Nitrospirota bacterium]